MKVVGCCPRSREHCFGAMAHSGPILLPLCLSLSLHRLASRAIVEFVPTVASFKAAEVSPFTAARRARAFGYASSGCRVAFAIQQRSFRGGETTARCQRVASPSLSAARSRFPVLLRSLSPNPAVNTDAPPARSVPTVHNPNLGSLGACRGAGRRLPQRWAAPIYSLSNFNKH